jgi:alkylation response protein AidB-like acyl-CoA dehydrogenase
VAHIELRRKLIVLTAYTDEQLELQRRIRDYLDWSDASSGPIASAKAEAIQTKRRIRQMANDGWLGVGWPAVSVGRGFGAIEPYIFLDEALRAGIPPMPAVSADTDTDGARRRGGSSSGPIVSMVFNSCDARDGLVFSRESGAQSG